MTEDNLQLPYTWLAQNVIVLWPKFTDKSVVAHGRTRALGECRPPPVHVVIISKWENPDF